jgi:hypothetical protein
LFSPLKRVSKGFIGAKGLKLLGFLIILGFIGNLGATLFFPSPFLDNRILAARATPIIGNGNITFVSL